MKPIDQNAPRARRRPGPVVAGAGWSLAISALACSLCWLAPEVAYPVGLIADLTAQVAFGAALLTPAAWTLRLHAGAAVLALAAIVSCVGVLADRAWTTAAVQHPALVVRVMTVNALAANPEPPDRVRAALLDANADIVALVESPGWLVEELKAGGVWRERYPAYWVNDRAGPGFRVVLSRWPLASAVTGERGAWRTAVEGFRECIVDRPAGRFVFILAHPVSPRTPTRFREGNAHVRRMAERDALREAGRGLPLVVAGDLNGSPTGARTRVATDRLPLRRAKPALHAAGTWPSWSVWPAAVAIDDALVSAGVRVVSWRALPIPGSDHAGVVMDLEIPAPQAPAAP